MNEAGTPAVKKLHELYNFYIHRLIHNSTSNEAAFLSTKQRFFILKKINA